MTIENFIGQYRQKLALHGEEEAMKMTLQSFEFYVKRETEKMTFREKFQIAVSSKIAPRLPHAQPKTKVEDWMKVFDEYAASRGDRHAFDSMKKLLDF